jgi:hypothetical protein
MFHIAYIIAIIMPLMALSGLFGRMGGAGKEGNWYDGLLDTKWRDCCCSLIIVGVLLLLCGWQPSKWWAYLAVFGLSWCAFSTYWDWLFRYDELFFSGFMVGLALFPAIWLGVPIWFIVIRSIVLCFAWGCLNKFLPNRVFLWRRDVAEEFCRYAISL